MNGPQQTYQIQRPTSSTSNNQPVVHHHYGTSNQSNSNSNNSTNNIRGPSPIIMRTLDKPNGGTQVRLMKNTVMILFK
jgi:hypothetical protein